MYIPKHFEISDEEIIFSFIEENAFGQLVSSVDQRPFSTHMPFLVSPDRKQLLGHVAKQNPQHSEIDGQEVLVTLQGPHDYISPSWYSCPGVPTWNYQAVHIYGKCSTFDDSNRLKEVVECLTSKFEAIFSEPWQPEYKASMLGAIIGIEISISEIQCKYKLSQNRSTKDQKQVIERLETLGANALAEAMERNTV
jgi:transcriptional regulator